MPKATTAAIPTASRVAAAMRYARSRFRGWHGLDAVVAGTVGDIREHRIGNGNASAEAGAACAARVRSDREPVDLAARRLGDLKRDAHRVQFTLHIGNRRAALLR